MVNDEQVDFTLEDESTLGDVVQAVQSWLADSPLVIDELSANGESLVIEDQPRWESRPIGDIAVLSVTAKTREEVLLETIQTIQEYLLLFREALKQKDAEVLQDIVHEYPAIEASLARILSDVYTQSAEGKLGDQAAPNSPSQDRLSSLIRRTSLSSGELPDEASSRELSVTIEMVQKVLAGRGRELTDPNGELRATLTALSAARDGLTDVPVLLQTGKDGEAMQHIIRFSELVSKLLRVAPRSEAEAIEGSKIGELNAALQELIEAFKQEDTVLIGDIVEYELAERVDTLVEALGDD